MKSEALLVSVLFFGSVGFVGAERKEDFCKRFNQELKINRKFLHYSFKDLAYIGKKQIEETMPKLEHEIARLKAAIKDKDSLLHEQESILNSPYLMDSFDEKTSELLKRKSNLQAGSERLRLQNKLIQKLHAANLIYLDVSLGKYAKQQEVKDLLLEAQKAENKIRRLKDKLIFPDAALLKNIQRIIDAKVKKLNDEKFRLNQMKEDKTLMLQEARKSREKLLKEYQSMLNKARALKSDSKKLVKSMKVDSLKNIYNTINQARQIKCTIEYAIE